MKRYFVVLVAIVLVGCAFGHTTSYQGVLSFNPSYRIPGAALSVVDKRPYVLDGQSPPSYSGSVRSLYGIPYNQLTASGKPLSEELQKLLVRTLAKNGYHVENGPFLPMTLSEQQCRRMLSKTGKKSILFVLKEWRTDVYMTPVFDYDLTMLVVDKHGAVISQATEKGELGLGPGKASKNLAGAEILVLSKLFNKEEIKAALTEDRVSERKLAQRPKSPTHSNEEPKKKDCSSSQILGMKKMGIGDNQIRTICK